MEQIDTQPESLPPAGSSFELGVWAGHTQALRAVSRYCSSVGAESLRRIRDSRSYSAVNLNWHEFCTQHLGISRSYADKLIQRLEEFGKPYFELTGILPLSADSYRRLAPAVTAAGIEIDGETVPIIPENATRIRKAVDALRQDLLRSREREPHPSITQLQVRFNAWIEELEYAHRPLDRCMQTAVEGLTRYALNQLQKLSARFERPDNSR